MTPVAVACMKSGLLLVALALLLVCSFTLLHEF